MAPEWDRIQTGMGPEWDRNGFQPKITRLALIFLLKRSYNALSQRPFKSVFYRDFIFNENDDNAMCIFYYFPFLN